ncbi:response regulator transcription factor [Fulvivirga ligni]|uniref:response regulator transcription factor n=1 Tax=Fulvivirga ligni TaxID=2904246 RepID=UPI001F1639C2|nr:response regulator transcription factor [Fulvivirga ligni]UII19671.1 response regulator transcription factor [Fulvivirga ligni]
MNKVLLVDRSPLVHLGYERLLQYHTDLTVAGNLYDLENISPFMESQQVKLTILEYDPDCITPSLCAAILKKNWSEHIILCCENMDQISLKQFYDVGVKALLHKNASVHEISQAIEQCLLGRKFYSHQFMDLLLGQKSDSTLTPREKEVLKLVAKGESTKSIAVDLNLSVHTVNSHRKNIIRKLSIQSPVEFVTHAIDLQLM